MKLTAIVIDDEQDAVSALILLIHHYAPEVAVVGTANSALEGLKLINQLKPDIAFIDVQMPGIDGLSLIETYDEKPFEVILTTASPAYSLKALKIGVTDYLLKPIIPEELQDAINKCKNKRRQPALNDTIVLADQAGYTVVKASDIIHIKGEGNYTTFYIRHRSPVVTSKHLKHYEQQLARPFLMRCHQSHIVNIQEVMSIKKEDGLLLVMSNGERIEVSRANREKVLRAFKPDF